MNMKSNEDCILVNVDCVAEVQNLNDMAFKFTLHNGEQLIVPAMELGIGGSRRPVKQVIPVSGMFALFEVENKLERCPVHMMTVSGASLQPMCIDLGHIEYLVDMPCFRGMDLSPGTGLYIISRGVCHE